ncbi:hypothetical protein [Streptococcus sp. Marseille-Q3533]|uniref:hypothetical protein n=1 Tax=Streptococcus sp. Marseille-Q3533 TaxID=2759692 RepID=UPI00202474CD|nr:hypothetical protein [Streptococcus sp. Marseille-Q3533]
MKSKILLGSMTLLSAFILAACGNGDKKTNETTAEPTTEVTTTAPTTTGDTSYETKAVSYADTQRIGRDDVGYVNVPKDWKRRTKNIKLIEYDSKDEIPQVILQSFAKSDVHPQNQDAFGVKFIATLDYNNLKDEEDVANIDGEWSKVGGENAYVLKSRTISGNYLFDWIFQKGEKVYVIKLLGTEEDIKTFRPMLEQSWGLDPNTPGK